jgi:hypothetical protein
MSMAKAEANQGTPDSCRRPAAVPAWVDARRAALLALGACAMVSATGGWLLGCGQSGPLGAGIAFCLLLALCTLLAREVELRLARPLAVLANQAGRAARSQGGTAPPPAEDVVQGLSAAVAALERGGSRSLARLRGELERECQASDDLQRQFAMMHMLRNLAAAGNRGVAAADQMRSALTEITAFLDWPVARLQLREGQTSAWSSTWYAPDASALKPFMPESDGRDPGSDGGLFARAQASRLPHWISDLACLEGWSNSRAAAAAGLRTGFVIPVRGESGLEAYLEFYCGHRVVASAELLELVDAISLELWQAVNRPLSVVPGAPAPAAQRSALPAARGEALAVI